MLNSRISSLNRVNPLTALIPLGYFNDLFNHLKRSLMPNQRAKNRLNRQKRFINQLLESKDFTNDLKYVSVDGSRVKSKRNRIVPVPEVIRDSLSGGRPDHFIFSNSPVEFNEDYFKTLWSRYKKQSKIIDVETTLYSFSHTGAIYLFKRTGLITKLQTAMGHSSIRVSLTYLRGLEVPELNEDDMPMIHF